MHKTLGGDRLGSGKKMKVELHNYERSTHDMSYLWRSSMAAGTLVPFLNEVALPGDTFDIKLDADVKTHPTVGPLFGSYKVQLDVFVAPIRLYQGQLHNNKLGIGRNMSTVLLPQLAFKTSMKAADYNASPDKDNAQINPSSIMSYLGLRGIGLISDTDSGEQTREFNAVPLLAYWEIYKNYYANKQEEIGAVLHTPPQAVIQTVTAIKADGQTVTQTSGGTPRVIYLGSVIEIDFAGAQPDPNQIIIRTIEQGNLTAFQLFGNFALTAAGVLKATYTNSNPLTINNWDYSGATNPTTGQPSISTFPLKNIDDMREYILANPSAVVISNTAGEPYKWIVDKSNSIPNILATQEGLALKTYQSDLYNNWLKTENIDAITTATAIDTTGGSFTIDNLNLAEKVYKLLNRINVSGGSYDDWIDAVYAHEHYDRCESPMYMGGLSKELIFQAVISNAGTQNQPLGTLAGRGQMSQKHKGGDIVIKIDEPSYIMGIVSLTPRVDYSQGNKWDVNLKTMDDFHKPQLDEIGFQELITEQMLWSTTKHDHASGVWQQKSAGKQPAWLNYMTNVNMTKGNFAVVNNEMFMTLNRRYEASSDTITDLTTYIDPSKFNFIFTETKLDSQNFWVQIACNITARRKMSAKVMPNL